MLVGVGVVTRCVPDSSSSLLFCSRRPIFWCHLFFSKKKFNAAAKRTLIHQGACSLMVVPPNCYRRQTLTPLYFLPSCVVLQLLHFMQNFEHEEGGFFWEMSERWEKWADMHQHLPLSMARLACSSFYEGKWAGAEEAFEHAVGQEFAWALLVVLWPGLYESSEWASWEEEHSFVEIMKDDLSDADTTTDKDELTFGLFSKLNESAEFRKEVEEYAASARE